MEFLSVILFFYGAFVLVKAGDNLFGQNGTKTYVQNNEVHQHQHHTPPWLDLPLLPRYMPELTPEYRANTLNKQIPRHLWMAFKEVPSIDKFPAYLTTMLSRNRALNWTTSLFGNKEKVDFMEKHFSGTSILWAFKSVNGRLGVMQADIWRYAVLYLFGGLYMDDDSYFESPWDEVTPAYFNILHKLCLYPSMYSHFFTTQQVIGISDTFIMSSETNDYAECYKKKHHLSSTQMNKKYNTTAEKLFNGKTICKLCPLLL